MQRKARTYRRASAYVLVGRLDAVNHDDAVAHAQAQHNGLARRLLHAAHVGPRERAQVGLARERAAQLDDAVAELVAPAVGRAYEVALVDERGERAEHHVLRHAEPLGDLGHAERARFARELRQHAQHALGREVRVGARRSGAGFLAGIGRARGISPHRSGSRGCVAEVEDGLRSFRLPESLAGLCTAYKARPEYR
jgi:hypothetical protein